MTKKEALGIRIFFYVVAFLAAAYFGAIYYLDNVIYDGRMVFRTEAQGMPLAEDPSLEFIDGEPYAVWSLNTACQGVEYEAVTDDYVMGEEPHAWFGGDEGIDCVETVDRKMDCKMALSGIITGYVEQGYGIWLKVKGGGCRSSPYGFYHSNTLVIGPDDFAGAEVALRYPYREYPLGLRGEFAVGELGPKGLAAERERIVSDGNRLLSEGSGAVGPQEMVRLSGTERVGLVGEFGCGPWSEVLSDGENEYLYCQAGTRPDRSRFDIYKNGIKQDPFFYGSTGADGPILESRMINGEPALTVRTPDVPTELILGDRLMTVDHTLSGARSPFEFDGKVGFVAERGESDFVMFDGERISRDFDEIRTVFCCATMPYPFVLHENGVLEFVGRRGESYYLVEVDLGGESN